MTPMPVELCICAQLVGSNPQQGVATSNNIQYKHKYKSASLLVRKRLVLACIKKMHAAAETYLAKEVLQGQQGGFPCWAGATAGGAHRQGLLLHDALVCGLQSQLAPA